jgi:hypothetical protein
MVIAEISAGASNKSSKYQRPSSKETSIIKLQNSEKRFFAVFCRIVDWLWVGTAGLVIAFVEPPARRPTDG